MKLENTTDHAILLPIGKDNEVLNIPRAVKQKVKNEKTGDDRLVVTNGVAEIDDAVLAKLRENPSVARYFTDGHLKVAGSGPPPASRVK